jgi:hypothetical protein
MNGSTLAFTGTVQSLGQSPEPGIEANDRTALVQIDRALSAPEELDLAQGSAIVVQLKDDQPALAPGDHRTFFADPLVYGAMLVVQEVGRSDEPAAAAPAAAAAGPEDDAAVEHAQAADAVVRASVIALRAAESNPQREHDPHWWIATLDVDMAAQGDVDEGELEVVYANSIDRKWREWPKPKAGQAGMWILHATEGDTERLGRFQLMHPEDLQPSTLLDALLGEAPEEAEEDDES